MRMSFLIHKMKLISNWKDILKKAWSIRLMLLASLLSGLEVVLPMVNEYFQRGVFAMLSLFVTAGLSLQDLLHKTI